ncbi:chaperone protein DnaJ 2-like [Panicum miliaceum]|uniref:Chaperone protein DnaJ 2-like n=1 Tax=Panicum miliaceum TaxID=4540 RepID=A0A3L6T7R9_PANMI|nr:chaperone protein DnaJ 2-like [Panicum miliaceum]
MSISSTVPAARFAGTINIRRSHCKVEAVATSARGGRSSVCSEGSTNKDYYKVLSLEHSAAVGAEEIRRAYRRLARRYHPDVCPPSRRAESTERFLELRRAYETLADPAQRVRYDAEMRAGGEEDGEAARPGGVEFPRDVWEAQLGALRARSEQRQRARSGGVRFAASRSDH